MIILTHLIEEDPRPEPDLRSMRDVVKMSNSIYNMVQLTGDCLSENLNGIIPLINTEVCLVSVACKLWIGRHVLCIGFQPS